MTSDPRPLLGPKSHGQKKHGLRINMVERLFMCLGNLVEPELTANLIAELGGTCAICFASTHESVWLGAQHAFFSPPHPPRTVNRCLFRRCCVSQGGRAWEKSAGAGGFFLLAAVLVDFQAFDLLG